MTDGRGTDNEYLLVERIRELIDTWRRWAAIAEERAEETRNLAYMSLATDLRMRADELEALIKKG